MPCPMCIPYLEVIGNHFNSLRTVFKAISKHYLPEE